MEQRKSVYGLDGRGAVRYGKEGGEGGGTSASRGGIRVRYLFYLLSQKSDPHPPSRFGRNGFRVLPVVKSWRLNERHYGSLQGLNKSETAAKYGEEQVKNLAPLVRRPPPLLESHDERNPAGQRAYQEVPKNELPLAES